MAAGNFRIDVSRQRRAAPRRRGFTLLEVMVAALAAAILFTGVSAALFLTLRTFEKPGPVETQTYKIATLAEQVLSDLAGAVTVTQLTARSIQFTILKRDGSGATETLRYAWAGTAGNPLTIEINGAAPVAVLENVTQFALTARTHDENYTQTTVSTSETAESTLATFSSWSGVTSTIQQFGLTPLQFLSEWVGLPVLASNQQYRITRFTFTMTRTSHNPNITVGVYPPMAAGSYDPSDSPYGTPVTFQASSGSGFGATQVTFSDVVFSYNAANGVCIRLTADDSGVNIQYLQAAAAPSNNMIMRSTIDAGLTWLPLLAAQNNWKDVTFTLYGKVITTNTNTATPTRRRLDAVELNLQTGSGAVVVQNAIHLPNQPDVTGL